MQLKKVSLSVILFIYLVHSQCRWDEINLGALSGQQIECTFNSNQYLLLYSPCKDDISCNIGGKHMAVQDQVEDNLCAAFLAQWDSGVSPEYSQYDGQDMYTFAYANGEASGGCEGGRYLDVFFVCSEDSYPYDASRTECGEEEQQCHYFIRVYTNVACPGGGGGGGSSSSSDDLSGGWIFIIILISVLFTYCAIGVVYMGTKKNDWTIPHAQVWLKVPVLACTGCKVTYEAIMKLTGKQVEHTDDGYELNDPSK